MARKHVMLSYQWDDQKLVTDVYNYLTEQMGLQVWMDIQGGMKSNIYECMAEGVQGAEVIVCFLTAKYQASPNCQQELQFARDAKVPIVACRVQGSWKPSAWLGLITAGLLLVDFRDVTMENFSSKMEELVKHIRMKTPPGAARNMKVDINGKQSTTPVTGLHIPKVAFASAPEAPPASTIAELQQRLEHDNTGALEGPKADVAAEALRDIVLQLKNLERRQFLRKLFLMLLFFPITFSFLPILIFYYYTRRSYLNKLGDGGIRHMIRIEGEQWSRYVEHMMAEMPRRKKSAACKRLLARGYGHILLGPECIILDALLSMTYENITAVRTEVIRAPNNIDMMLRVWFCQRAMNQQANTNNNLFKFDIFLPPDMATEELSSIVNLIMLESKCQRLF